MHRCHYIKFFISFLYEYMYKHKLCLGETNETYERFLFNSRQKNETESVDQYITALRTLAKTCNFCACLRHSHSYATDWSLASTTTLYRKSYYKIGILPW